jgi:uncharacterized phosphosugar-binding protein
VAETPDPLEKGREQVPLDSPLAVAQKLLEIGATAAIREAPKVMMAAVRLAQAISQGGTVYAFGAGHAQAFAMELCSRAGGLPHFLAMNLEDIRLDKRDAWLQLKDSGPERDPRNAVPLLEHHGVTRADCLLIASNSGRNGAIVELGLECQRRGIYTIGLTSLNHSLHVESRHPSGLRLSDVVNDVIDLHTPLGDAIIEVHGHGRTGAPSTISFIVLAQMLNFAVANELIALGSPVEFTVSANVGV